MTADASALADTSALEVRIRRAFLAGYGAAARSVRSSGGSADELLGSYHLEVECIEQKVQGCKDALAESASMSEDERRQVQEQLRDVLIYLGQACELLQGKLSALAPETPATKAST
ncbi:MAG TPA: hypothetical protein VJN18_35390 [Polyangiaceae bacterium]|nr:hypothetical protein [Polyangiaceae bacterium]